MTLNKKRPIGTLADAIGPFPFIKHFFHKHCNATYLKPTVTDIDLTCRIFRQVDLNLGFEISEIFTLTCSLVYDTFSTEQHLVFLRVSQCFYDAHITLLLYLQFCFVPLSSLSQCHIRAHDHGSLMRCCMYPYIIHSIVPYFTLSRSHRS